MRPLILLVSLLFTACASATEFVRLEDGQALVIKTKDNVTSVNSKGEIRQKELRGSWK